MSTIAIVAPAIAREGITKQIANQVLGLHQRQVKVCLVVIAKSNINILQEYGVDIADLNILQLHQPVAYLSPRAFLGSVMILWPTIRYLKEQKATHVIAHAPYAHFVMRLAKLLASLHMTEFTLAQYFHGLQYSEYPVNTARRLAVNSLNRWLAKYCDDVHISVSEVVKKEVMQCLLELPNHAVLYNSISEQKSWGKKEEMAWQLAQPVLQLASDKYKILIPNRIDHNKGQLFFLNVLEKFMITNGVSASDITLLIVGDGPQRQMLEQAVRQRKLKDLVVVMGELPNAVVQRLMKHVQLVVVPSFKEGLPFTVLEALSAGCLVLASSTGGIPEVIADHKTGFLFETGDEVDCLRRLSYIFTHRQEALVDNSAIDETIRLKLSLQTNTDKLLQLVTNIK